MIVLSSYYFTREYKNNLFNAFEGNAVKTADLISLAINLALEEHQFNLVKRIFDGAIIDKNVIFIILFDNQQKQFAAYNPKSLQLPDRFTTADSVFARLKTKNIFIVHDIFSKNDNQKLAKLVLGYNLESLNAQISHFRSISILISIISFLVGYILIQFTSNRITNSIYQLQKRMQEIIDTGKYSGHVDIASNDEIGLLANNFIDLMKEVQTRHELLKQSELNLKKVNSKLENINRLKSAMVTDASHQLRTPLTIIRGEAEVALEDVNEEKTYRDALKIIADESYHLSKTVDNLLSLAQADAGNLVYLQKDVDFSDICWRQIELAKRQAIIKGITVIESVNDNCILTGDPNRLDELVYNLVSNAIKYTPEKGYVQILLKNKSDHALLTIKDSGRGILPEDMNKVFCRFYRGKNVKKLEKGSGLGLAICRCIVNAHSGSINFTSKVGIGTTFKVKLKLSRPI
ncbi:hypothetical protein KC799_14650 [candidate division KSB1 bacterium]|nr:hypothetical protein [candidate division KSB1 bacterium]